MTALLLFSSPFRVAGDQTVVQVRISSSPEGADVWVDDKETPRPVGGVVRLPPGEHTVRLELAGFKPSKETIVVQANPREQAFDFTLERAAPEYKVSFRSEFDGAAVFIDGNYAVALTNGLWSLRQGKHHVVLVHPEKGSKEIDIDVKAVEGKAQEFGCPLTAAPSVPGRPRALVVGVQDYGGLLPACRHAQGDAIDLAYTLRAVGYRDSDVALLIQSPRPNEPARAPSAAEIRKELARFKECSAGDTVVVAMVGLVVKSPGGYAFCPHAANPLRPETLLPLDEIFEALKKNCRAKTKVVLLDAVPRVPAVDKIAFPRDGFDPSRLAVPEGIILACSCGVGQESHAQVDYRRGAFFDALIHGLWGAAADKDHKVTVQGLLKYASSQTRNYVAANYEKGNQQPFWREGLGSTSVMAWPPRELCLLAEAENTLELEPLEQGKLDRAEKALEPLFHLQPPPLEALVKRAQLRLRQGTPDRAKLALEDCAAAEKREPRLAVIQVLRGDALDLMKAPPQAVDAYDRALKLDPYVAEAFNSRGTVNYALRKDTEALQDFDRAIEWAIKRSPSLYKNRAQINRKIKRCDLVLQDMERAMLLMERSPAPKQAREELYQQLVDDCTAAIKWKDPSYEKYKAYTLRGVAYAKLEKWDLALASLDEAIKMKPHFASALDHRTKILELKKKAKP